MQTPDTTPTTLAVWHPLAPHGCTGCGTTTQPHFTRLLCNACYVSARRYGVLARYPLVSEQGYPVRVVAPHTTAGMYTGRAMVRRQRRETAWTRQLLIRDHLGRFITDEAQRPADAA